MTADRTASLKPSMFASDRGYVEDQPQKGAPCYITLGIFPFRFLSDPAAAGLRQNRGPIACDARLTRLLLLRMRTLARSQITIQFVNVFENGHTRKSFNDLENFPNLRLQMDERGLATPFFELLAGRGKNAQPRAADEFQLRQVEHEVLDTLMG